MANGKIVIGFSKPYVALYSATGTTVSYTSGQILARGVSVKVNANSSSDNDFYADNQLAESAGGTFTDGTIDLGIDGLKAAARKLIMGLGTAGTDGWTANGDAEVAPYVGLGFIVEYMEDGVKGYQPFVFPKCKFDPEALEAATRGDSIDFQTTSLSVKIFRSDDANHNWKFDGPEETTEASAEAKLKAKLEITGTAPQSED